MFSGINPWAPSFARVVGLGQITPLVSSSVPAAPAAAAPSGGGAGAAALGIGSAALVLGISSLSVLFTYGIARDSKSSMVKTTGYILAGLGTLVAVVEAGTIGYAVTRNA